MPIPDSSVFQHQQGPVLFIADLHLDPSRPDINTAFVRFCETTAREAAAVYILGDLFEVWIGDDDDEPAWQPVLDALRALTESGVAVRFLPGNRDFLVDSGFTRRTGVECIPDPSRVSLFDTPTLLCHGDLLCTDDVEHQDFRQRVQNVNWRKDFLAHPLSERRTLAREMRAGSRDSIRFKAEDIMDVNQNAVEDVVREHGVSRLIHGHTHRPARHIHEIEGRTVERWVLGDWYEQASMLVADDAGLRMETFDMDRGTARMD